LGHDDEVRFVIEEPSHPADTKAAVVALAHLDRRDHVLLTSY
jgi:hypothetical protein